MSNNVPTTILSSLLYVAFLSVMTSFSLLPLVSSAESISRDEGKNVIRL